MKAKSDRPLRLSRNQTAEDSKGNFGTLPAWPSWGTWWPRGPLIHLGKGCRFSISHLLCLLSFLSLPSFQQSCHPIFLSSFPIGENLVWVEGSGSLQLFFSCLQPSCCGCTSDTYSSCFHTLWDIFLFLHNVFPPQLIFLECFYSTQLLFSSKFVLHCSVMLLRWFSPSYLGLGGFFASWVTVFVLEVELLSVHEMKV